MSFYGLIQLIMLMEGLMDRVNYPQRSEEPRAFRKKEAQPVPAAGGGAKPLATFRVSVLFRQNASWQGTLLWTERAVDAQFRSVLELIRLLDSALTEELEGTYDR